MISDYFQTWPVPADHIVGTYDPFLVLLSYLVATSASYIALDFAGRLREATEINSSIFLWLLGGAISMGAGIWSMHFVGMLSFSVPMITLHYDVFWTTLSLIVAIIASGFALFVLKNENFDIKHLVFGGIILGLAIASMHYTGMQAMTITMGIHYVPSLFILSIIVAIGASLAALWLAIKSNQVYYKNRMRLKVVSAIIMGIAICGMHYTGMAAAIFGPLCAVTVDTKAIDPTILAIGISGITFIILGSAFFASSYKEELNQQKIQKARQLGMAEVASSVLHNVGNTLNSINTSIELLDEKVNHSKMDNLSPLVNLMQQHKNDMPRFLVEDPQGQHVIEFITLLLTEWNNQKQFFSNEISGLKKNVWHIKSIIRMQQSLSHAVGMTEEASMTELLEDALTLNKIAYERMAIKIVRDYHPIKTVIVDKVKVFQIVVNLIKNSIDSLQEVDSDFKQLTLRLKEKDSSHFMIQVEDNGVGILNENILKIFSHGYTTKLTGHGFGLHASALDAQDMNGSLVAESEGAGKGAKFILVLPYKPNAGGRHEPK